MSFNLERARTLANVLNEKLKPIADQPVDVNEPSWAETMRQSEPLDDLGIRAEAESLLVSLLDAYAAGPGTQRAAIRNLLAKNPAFMWATGLPVKPDTAGGFRLHLLSVSARWGSEDPRDLMLALKDIHETAHAAGVNTQPILSEIAALSDDSLADMLRRMR